MPTDLPITTVSVNLDLVDGIFYVNSNDIPGLHLCGRDLESLAIDTLEAIKVLYKKNKGLDVIVKPAADPDSFAESPNLATKKQYIAFPAAA